MSVHINAEAGQIADKTCFQAIRFVQNTSQKHFWKMQSYITK